MVAFSELAGAGVTVTAIAARFGVSERIVEQRLRLGNAAPELLDAYRVEEIDLETLKAFAVTTDHDRQRAVWEQVSAQGYRPSAWQVKRMLTEERVPAGSAMARYVGVDAYEAAGGPVLRDLFADEHENGVWLEDPALLNQLAIAKLTAAADELATRWKCLEVAWPGRPPRPPFPANRERRHDEPARRDREHGLAGPPIVRECPQQHVAGLPDIRLFRPHGGTSLDDDANDRNVVFPHRSLLPGSRTPDRVRVSNQSPDSDD